MANPENDVKGKSVNDRGTRCRLDGGISIARYMHRFAVTGVVKLREPIHLNHNTIIHDFTGIVVNGLLRRCRMKYSFGSGVYRVEKMESVSRSSMGTINMSMGIALLLCNARNFAIKPLEEWNSDEPSSDGMAELMHKLALRLEEYIREGVRAAWKV